MQRRGKHWIDENCRSRPAFSCVRSIFENIEVFRFSAVFKHFSLLLESEL
jgi:hypothetical protein